MNARCFGQLPSGETVEAYRLSNATGASMEIITLGGIVTSLRVPDREGQLDDVVLGFNDLAEYAASHPYFGAIAGRVAGRITEGRFRLDGTDYQLAINAPPHHLHGGETGLDRRIWGARSVVRPDGADSLALSYVSPAGEEGYPGTVAFTATYTLTADNAVIFETESRSDALTPVSLTQHSYFNLGGEGGGTVEGHQVHIRAKAFVPVADPAMTLTGRIELLAGQPNDLNAPRRLGDVMGGIYRSHGDLYLLSPATGADPRFPGCAFCARVTEPVSGRVLEVFTDESCLQFYTGVSLDGTRIGKAGRPYVAHAGLCLECEGYPDGLRFPALGEILVRPNVPRRRRTVYAFSAS
jgi:aldose 1-epimerase